jgi:mono/diheme cytochrome c family protein
MGRRNERGGLERNLWRWLSLLLGLGWYFGGGFFPGEALRAAARSDSPRSKAATRLFRQYCARCHGADFSGNGWRERGHTIPDFTSRAWQKGRSDVQLRVSVLEGKGTRMPGFQGKISNQEVRDLVQLIRQFQPVRAAAAEAAPDDFARRYAQLRQELEELRRQFIELRDVRGRTRPSGRERGSDNPDDATRRVRFPPCGREVTAPPRP